MISAVLRSADPLTAGHRSRGSVGIALSDPDLQVRRDCESAKAARDAVRAIVSA